CARHDLGPIYFDVW
nr:immunoglobulin heavy chain junction region [Mus musculus]